jgi:8-oxo-dGTP pyrophosphatase MutT (NUDIX family)
MSEPVKPGAGPLEVRGPWRVVTRREVYRNPWIVVREDHVIHPDGRPGFFGIVQGRPSAAIVAVNDDGEVYLVGQHRYAINLYSWDIPGGALDSDEDPLAGAQRELREETGLRAEEWTALGAYHPHRDLLEVTAHLFLAQRLSTGAPAPDGSEQLALQRVPLAEALRRVQRGEISAGTSAVGLLRAWGVLHGGQPLSGTETFEH